MKQLISVQIDSPDQSIWEGNARSVSSVNSAGPFDILPLHATFISLIEDQPITIVNDQGRTLKFSFSHSVVFNQDNKVFIFANL